MPSRRILARRRDRDASDGQPGANVILPESVNDAGPNPLWSTVYYHFGTHRSYDNSGNLLGTTTFGEYPRIEIGKIDDAVCGAPYNALQIEARSGPTVKGPWTILEHIILRQTMTGSDSVNCDGSAPGSTRRLPARIRGRAVQPLLLVTAVFRKVLRTWWRREDSNLRHGAYETPALPPELRRRPGGRAENLQGYETGVK
jgi:hypothetical protein